MSVTSSSPIILITTLAIYQTEFWAKVGIQLKLCGHDVAFLSFDDRSTELLKSLGLETFAATGEELVTDTSDAAFEKTLSLYGITDVNYWFSHERITFGISDSQELRRKLMAYLSLADRACSALLESGRDVTMVQELGGFISVIASFFAARKHEIDNWFIEPAFFKGRMFFLKNSFAALRFEKLNPTSVSAEVRDYLDRTLESGAIVVPQKDLHQYTTAFRKVINFRNLRRLAEKLIDKYFKGKHHEFGYIGRHVSVHAQMLLNSFRLRGNYTALVDVRKFVYYPLHVPADMALTLRSPHYLDQLALVDYMARIVPHTHLIAIKEHPAMIGAIDAGRLLDLLHRYDNVALLPPSTNNYEVIKAADCLISINSKSGAEATLLGKPVFVLGDAFYRGAPMVTDVDRLSALPQLLSNRIGEATFAHNEDLIGCYFEKVWRHSYQGELYVTDQDNIERFAYSMIKATKQN
jgi:hypothetical protein